jgi:hypothetical protein
MLEVQRVKKTRPRALRIKDEAFEGMDKALS